MRGESRRQQHRINQTARADREHTQRDRRTDGERGNELREKRRWWEKEGSGVGAGGGGRGRGGRARGWGKLGRGGGPRPFMHFKTGHSDSMRKAGSVPAWVADSKQRPPIPGCVVVATWMLCFWGPACAGDPGAGCLPPELSLLMKTTPIRIVCSANAAFA